MLKPLTFVLSLLGAVVLANGAAVMAEEAQYTLKGRIMDTSDNWLPDARVGLKIAGVVTKTDGNGLFELTFTPEKPYEAKKGRTDNGVYEFLEVDKEGHIGTSIPVKDLEFFNKPVELKLEPNPVGKDNVGFTVRMSRSNTLQALSRKLKIETGEYVEPQVYTDYFAKRKIRDDNDNSERVSFHCYVPEGVERVKASFLISRHGMGTIDLPVLREFAADNDLALIGIFTRFWLTMEA